jgi:hypothetical protein
MQSEATNTQTKSMKPMWLKKDKLNQVQLDKVEGLGF